MPRRSSAAGFRDDPARPWYELAERTRALANMVRDPQQAAFRTLADQYEATATRLEHGFEKAQEVLRGFQGHIRSNWEIELLLLLANEPNRNWSVAELTAELRSSRRAITEALGSLQVAGLAKQDSGGRYCYCPRSRQLADLVRQFERACALLPVSVIAAIFSSRKQEESG